MGYTHYWNHTGFSNEQWRLARKNAKKILEASSIPVWREYDEDAPPVVSLKEIRFNGIENTGHETFLISRFPTRSDFCKTARKPYDTIVVAILGMLSDINDEFNWGSDGDKEDHAEGIELYNKALAS